MMCLKENTHIAGNYNTDKGSTLMVAFERCDTRLRTKCKSDKEIRDWLQERWFLIMENDKEFSQREFDHDSVTMASFVYWYKMSPDYNIDYVREVERQKFSLNDSFWNLGSITQSTDQTGFKSV